MWMCDEQCLKGHVVWHWGLGCFWICSLEICFRYWEGPTFQSYDRSHEGYLSLELRWSPEHTVGAGDLVIFRISFHNQRSEMLGIPTFPAALNNPVVCLLIQVSSRWSSGCSGSFVGSAHPNFIKILVQGISINLFELIQDIKIFLLSYTSMCKALVIYKHGTLNCMMLVQSNLIFLLLSSAAFFVLSIHIWGFKCKIKGKRQKNINKL